MDTNLMIVWLFGIAVGGIVIFLVAQKVVIKKGEEGFSVEFERKVDQKIQEINNLLQKELKQIETSHLEKMKDYEAKLSEIMSMVAIEKEKTFQQKDNVILAKDDSKIEEVDQQGENNYVESSNGSNISGVRQG